MKAELPEDQPIVAAEAPSVEDFSVPSVDEILAQPNQQQMKACPFCGENILAVAIVCKHCKSNLQSVQSSPPPNVPVMRVTPAGQTDAQKKVTNGCLGCLGVVVAFFILVSLTGKSGKSEPSKFELGNYAETFVTRQLKAPSTAKYPSAEEYTVAPMGGGKYIVSGYVDAQNSFGAMIRNHFTVTITIKPDGSGATMDVISIY